MDVKYKIKIHLNYKYKKIWDYIMILIKFYGTDNLVLSNSFGKLKSFPAYHVKIDWNYKCIDPFDAHWVTIQENVCIVWWTMKQKNIKITKYFYYY